MAESRVTAVAQSQSKGARPKRLQFSFNVELPIGEDSRLQSIKDRLQICKKTLGLSKKTSSTQNADLIEALLVAFEFDRLKDVHSSSTTLHSSPLGSSGSPRSFRISPLRSRDLNLPSTSGSFLHLSPDSPPMPFSPSPTSTSTPRRLPVYSPCPESTSQHSVCSSSSNSLPRTEQVTTPASRDDEIVLCTQSSLQSLVAFFVENEGVCPFCKKPFVPSTTKFIRQGHCSTMILECLCQDKVKWVSSPIMASGSVVKYYVNMR